MMTAKEAYRQQLEQLAKDKGAQGTQPTSREAPREGAETVELEAAKKS